MEAHSRAVKSTVRPLQLQQKTIEVVCEIAPSIRKSEFYEEEIVSQTTVHIQRPLPNVRALTLAYFALVVLLFAGLCLATEGSVPLAYVLLGASVVSCVSFCLLKL